MVEGMTMSSKETDLYTLTNKSERLLYEFQKQTSGMYRVIRVWLNDGEREYMGTYQTGAARGFWNSLVSSGFTRA